MPPPGFKTVTISERVYALLVIRARLTRKTIPKIIEALLGISLAYVSPGAESYSRDSPNDYSIGALEALSWVLALLDKVHTNLLSHPL